MIFFRRKSDGQTSNHQAYIESCQLVSGLACVGWVWSCQTSLSLRLASFSACCQNSVSQFTLCFGWLAKHWSQALQPVIPARAGYVVDFSGPQNGLAWQQNCIIEGKCSSVCRFWKMQNHLAKSTPRVPAVVYLYEPHRHHHILARRDLGMEVTSQHEADILFVALQPKKWLSLHLLPLLFTLYFQNTYTWYLVTPMFWLGLKVANRQPPYTCKAQITTSSTNFIYSLPPTMCPSPAG